MFVHRELSGFDDVAQYLYLLRRAIAQGGEKFFHNGVPTHLCVVKEKIIGANIQGSGDGYENRKTQLGVACFNVAHVGGGNADLLCQVLLRQLMCFSEFPYSLPNFVIIQEIHRPCD